MPLPRSTKHSISLHSTLLGDLLFSVIDSVCRSPHLARSHYCQFCLSVSLSVCHAPSNRFFCFVSRWNRAIFWPSSLHVSLYKTLFFDFWFRPNAQNLLPKIGTQSPISRLVWQIDRRCLQLPGGFRGWPIQWNHAKCCGPTLVAMATKFGLKSISRLVWQIDCRCLHLPGDFRGPNPSVPVY